MHAIATKSFTRSDTKTPVSAGDEIYGEPSYISELYRVGLVRAAPQRKVLTVPEWKTRPCEAVGPEVESSASPAAQALPQTSVKKSKRGGSRKKKEKPDE